MFAVNILMIYKILLEIYESCSYYLDKSINEALKLY